MPQTKKQEIAYTIMMVCVMVYAMVCYNISLEVGGMQNFVFLAAFLRTATTRTSLPSGCRPPR